MLGIMTSPRVFQPRRTKPLIGQTDPDGLKMYTISATGAPVDPQRYTTRLAVQKRVIAVPWRDTAAFAILHDGASLGYLVIGWWGNDNELFTSVSVTDGHGWVEDPRCNSFCLWDLEVMWHERNAYIRHLYSGRRDLAGYRADFLPPV